MNLGGDIKRGRPAGRMTIAGRKAMDYVLRQQSKAQPIIIGEMVRVCGFSCPANAKRTLKRLKEIGAVDLLNRGGAA